MLYDFRFPGTDAEIRARLETELAARGPGMLFQRLREVDPAAASAIGPRNGRRIVRALEVVELTGEPFGSGLPDESRLREPTVILGLRAPRAELVARLDARVEGMWHAGLLDEVSGLLAIGLERGITARRAIGYAQAVAQLEGALGEVEAIGQAASLTRRYARRQVGWFRRYPHAAWLDYDDANLVDRALALAWDHA